MLIQTRESFSIKLLSSINGSAEQNRLKIIIKKEEQLIIVKFLD